MFKMRA